MDETIEARFVNGDPQAMRDLYRAHGAALFGAAYRILGDRTLAEDAVQQALIQAWRAADRFDPDRNIAPWLVTITKRCAIDVYRKEKRHRADELADYDAAVVAPGIETAWDVFRVRTALKQLADAEREILVLTHFTGMTHEDAAQHLEIPLGTVKSRSYRAYRKLTKLLAELEEGEQ